MAEQTGRQPLPEQEGSSPLEIAGIVGGAALGYKYRRAIGKGIKVVTHESSMAMRGAAIQAAKMSARNTPVGNAMGEVGSYLKSLDHALDQKNPLFHMRNKDRFDNRFTRTFKDLQEERMRMARTPLGGKPTKIQNEYLSMMKGLQKERKDFVRSTQFEETMKRLSSVLPERMKEGGLENVLRQKRDDLFFESPSLKKVDELLKMHSKENAKKNNLGNALDFVDEIERKKTAETVYQTMTTVKKDKNVKEIAKKNYKEYRDIRMEAFKADHSIDKNGKWMEAAQRRGLKPLTLKETLNRGLIDQDSADFLVPLEKASKMSPKNLANNFRIHMKSDKELGDLHVDPGLFLDKSGNVVDMRNSIDGGLNFLDIVKDNVQLPYLRFNPLDLAHYSSIKTIREAPKSYVLKRGDIDPFLQGARTVQHPAAHNRDAAAGTLADDHIFVGGNVYRMHDMNKVDEGVYLADRRFGIFSRMPASMANLHVRNYDDVGPVKNFFGFGLQETPSSFANIKSMFTKFKDPDWEINQVRTMMKGQYKDLDEVEGIYKNLYSSFNEKTTNFSSTTIDFLNPHVKKAYGNVDIDLTKLNTTEEIMGAVGRIRQAIGSPEFDGKISKGNTALAEQFDEMWTKFSRSPQGFLKNKRISSDNGAVLPEFASALETGETELVGILDDAKRLIQQHSIHQVNMTTEGTSRIVRNAILEGDLDKNALGEVRNMEVLSKMRTWWKDVYRNRNTYGDDALEEFAGLMKGEDSIFGQAIHQSIKEFNPLTSTGPGMKPPNYFGPTTGYGIMRDAKGIGWAKENYEQLVEDGSSSVSAFLNSTKEVLKQPFAGRNNLGDVTTATTFFYYGVERMDNALSKVGLGLAQKDKGSMQSILVNQLGKRILLPYVAYKELEYLDDMTGDTISDSLADTYVNMHGDLAGVKETLGINRIGKELTAPFAGAGQLGELPFLKAFDFLTLGAFSDFRSEEEVNKYYESGEDAVRKGRYWGLGSNTPWAGGKIERWEPNWYRKAKSDYEYTDTLYGSANDYWANTWIPTLSNPIAPLTYMLNGHSYLEKKHEEDRPYPIKGGTILSDFPIVGPLADNTIGRIISPRTVRADLQEQHERYQDEVIAASSRRFDAYSEGASIQLMPAGGLQVYEDMPSGDGGYEEGYGSGGGGAIGLGGGASSEGGVAIEGTERMVGAGDYSSAALTAINQRITMRGQAAVNQSKMRPLTQLESLRDPEALADLADIGEIGNPSGVARDMFYSASEVLGIYGFGTKALSGFQEGGRGLTLEPSSRMDSMARSFWDMELGGADMVGGGFSEIFRRYIPRDPNKNYYNPIRNTMPDWMPGAEYFLPFKYGDPYVKVSKGEMRLPGEAYESLYKLHPDEFSQEDGSKYGAFDRFRILADVAPYSDQYRMWKRVVSQMNQDGRLTDDMKDEYQEVMTQVRERKKKYQFFDKRFTNADIDMQDVTVTKILDQNTFLTEEFPNNPIKLAGVSIKKDDEEAQSLLRQFVYEGAKIRVGLDADPLFRVRDDMMNTMRAVVYAGNSEEGMPFYMTQKGQNVNYMLANRSFGGFMGFGGENKVSVKDDGSATATQALFSNDQITVGKAWEFLSHDLLPSLPIIGPIADKFLQVRSPLEQYKRTEVYGKAWRPWEEPISGWLQPMIETMASRNPLIASAQGYGIGWLAGRGKGKYYGKWIGALVGGGAAALRVLSEHTPGKSDVWLPERRKKEREVNEYFDRLKYMKFKGLYEKAAEEAKRTEGVDLKELLDENSKRGKKNKQSRKTLELYKKQLAMQKKMGYGDDELTEFQLKRIRENLKTIGEDRSSVDIGPHTLLALQYKAEYESTLFGADPNGDMTKIFRSLPKKDREYFAEFMKAAPDEREEILRLVPENERRFFQAKWGMKMDKVESNESYFKDHYLPSENWEGWRADTALNDIKLKVVRNEGMELTEFGFWGSDETRADASGVDAIDMQPRMMGDLINSSRIEKVLRGAGLDDVQVTVQRSPSKDDNIISVGFDMMKDRTSEIIQELNTNWTKVFN